MREGGGDLSGDQIILGLKSSVTLGQSLPEQLVCSCWLNPELLLLLLSVRSDPAGETDTDASQNEFLITQEHGKLRKRCLSLLYVDFIL